MNVVLRDAARRGREGSGGFSMIEVLIVMVIIAILAAIAIPMYLGQRDRAKDAAARAGGRQIATALLVSVLDSEADDPWPATCDQSTVGPYLVPDQWPGNPFDEGTLMHTVTGESLGNYLYTRDASGPEPRPYRLTVFLKRQADFVVP
jgi:prepilin-type N-terminal cleavage/methylation domain-containing protein